MKSAQIRAFPGLGAPCELLCELLFLPCGRYSSLSQPRASTGVSVFDVCLDVEQREEGQRWT